MREISKTISLPVSKDDKGNASKTESFFVTRMPLRQATEAWDIVMKTYGKPLSSIITRIYLNAGGKVGTAKITIEDIEPALTDYVKSCEIGQTYTFIETILNPDFVKYNGLPVELNEVYNKFGLLFLFKLCFEIGKFNFEDFFFSK